MAFIYKRLVLYLFRLTITKSKRVCNDVLRPFQGRIFGGKWFIVEIHNI